MAVDVLFCFFNKWIRPIILCGVFWHCFSTCRDLNMTTCHPSKRCSNSRAALKGLPCRKGHGNWSLTDLYWILAVRRLRMIFFSKMMLFSFGDPKSTILTWPCRWINQHFFKTRSTKITHTMTLDFGLWILKVYKFLFWYSWGWWQLCGVSDIVSSNKSGRKGVVGDYDDDGIDDPDRQIFFSMSTPLLDANTFLYLDFFWTFSLLLIFVGQFSLTWKHRINNLLSVLEHLKQGCQTLIRSKGSLAGQAAWSFALRHFTFASAYVLYGWIFFNNMINKFQRFHTLTMVYLVDFRRLLGADEVRSKLERCKMVLDSLFTGLDCPHAAMQQLSTACRRRTFTWYSNSLFPFALCGVILFSCYLSNYLLSWTMATPNNEGMVSSWHGRVAGHVTLTPKHESFLVQNASKICASFLLETFIVLTSQGGF